MDETREPAPATSPVPPDAPPEAPPAGARAVLFGPSHRATTTGVLLLVSMVAFEAMGVNTAMPALVTDLGGLHLYAWPFVAFMAAGVLGTVVGGRLCDLVGPRLPLVVAPVLFGAGLLTAGSAAAMPQLLAGRVLQGLGAGSVTVAIYVLIARLYPERARPAMFGAMSSAWVLPSLIGPPIAGLVTDRLSWRWVFYGLVPVVVLALALVVPAVRRLERPDRSTGASPRRRGLIPAAFGAAAGVSTVIFASERPSVVAGLVAVVGFVVLLGCLRVLLPAGVFRARRGVPSVVAARGLCAALFFTATSYLPLMLSSTHHWSLTAAGIPLVVGSLGWSSASAWQGGKPDLPRPVLLRTGFGLLTFGALALLLVAPSWGVPWLAIPVWAVAGVGMGLCFPSVGFLLLRQSDPAVVGFHTSAAQMCDQLGTATMIGLGGAFLALLGTAAAAMPVLLVLLAVLGVLGVLVAGRTVAPG